MLKNIMLVAVLVFMFAGAAESGNDYWTNETGIIAVDTMNANQSYELLASATGVLPLLKALNCGHVLAWTDSLAATVDFEWCMYSDGSNCRKITTATPINTLTEYGLEIVPMGKFLKITLLTGTNIQFQSICRP